MSYIEKFSEDGPLRKMYLVAERITAIIPDKIYLKIIYRLRMGKRLNLNPPVTFNEKLQWLKLYNRKDEYTQMVDKAEAKEIVAKKIGAEHIIPTLGVWDRYEDIDFDKLPEQFVLKCTHDSGSVIVCKDKSKWNHDENRKHFSKALKRSYFWGGQGVAL